jgi:hypothetical protein
MQRLCLAKLRDDVRFSRQVSKKEKLIFDKIGKRPIFTIA